MTTDYSAFVDICKSHQTDNVKLFDFGNGVLSMPMADPSGQGWLNQMVSYFVNVKTKYRMGVTFGPYSTKEQVERDCKNAAAFLKSKPGE